MLLATNVDVTYVQHQVGHAESRMTLDVYSQLLDRQKRDHGVAFDALLADARSTLYGSQNEGFRPNTVNLVSGGRVIVVACPGLVSASRCLIRD
jgi:hypothetical protein